MKTETYVSYFYPGSFFEESDSRTIQDRDINIALDIMDKRAVAFQFFDKVTQSATREDGKTFEVVEKVNKSPKYYPGGAVYTLEQIEKLYGKDSILYRNTKNNCPDGVIKTRAGNFHEFAKDTKICKEKY